MQLFYISFWSFLLETSSIFAHFDYQDHVLSSSYLLSILSFSLCRFPHLSSHILVSLYACQVVDCKLLQADIISSRKASIGDARSLSSYHRKAAQTMLHDHMAFSHRGVVPSFLPATDVFLLGSIRSCAHREAVLLPLMHFETYSPYLYAGPADSRNLIDWLDLQELQSKPLCIICIIVITVDSFAQ